MGQVKGRTDNAEETIDWEEVGRNFFWNMSWKDK